MLSVTDERFQSSSAAWGEVKLVMGYFIALAPVFQIYWTVDLRLALTVMSRLASIREP